MAPSRLFKSERRSLVLMTEKNYTQTGSKNNLGSINDWDIKRSLETQSEFLLHLRCFISEMCKWWKLINTLSQMT